MTMAKEAKGGAIMENAIKYHIEVVYEDGCSETCLLETKRFDTKEEALDWYHTSFATADTWACSIRLVGTKYDENGFAVDVFCEELTGI